MALYVEYSLLAQMGGFQFAHIQYFSHFYDLHFSMQPKPAHNGSSTVMSSSAKYRRFAQLIGEIKHNPEEVMPHIPELEGFPGIRIVSENNCFEILKKAYPQLSEGEETEKEILSEAGLEEIDVMIELDGVLPTSASQGRSS